MFFSEGDEFRKEFKKLSKKYKTLGEDLEVVKRVIKTSPVGNGTKHWNILKYDGSKRYVIKMRMMCRAVRGSQFRVIYYYDGDQVEILFIEIYFKGNKEGEDEERIERYSAELFKD